MNKLTYNIDKYKIVTIPTLLEDWSMLKKKACPFCFKPLKEMRTKPLYYCPSKKHNFVISKSKIHG